MADPSLRQALEAGEFILAPGVFDMISAKVADGMGFECLYVTGFGTVASHLGVADAGIATYTDMVSRMGTIARGCRTPLISDADTGYGGLLNVRHTVQGYEASGVTAIQLDLLGTQFEFNYVRYILFGIILLLMLRFRPQGLWPEPRRTTKANKVVDELAAGGSPPPVQTAIQGGE